METRIKPKRLQNDYSTFYFLCILISIACILLCAANDAINDDDDKWFVRASL